MRVVRAVLGLLGEFLITAGAFLLLFVAWQLWWTDVVSDADAEQTVAVMEQEYDNSAWVQPKKVKLGDAYAIVRIPRFGAKFARPLYEGTTHPILGRGVGHYVGTAQPGQVGNFSMAGHRTTYGKPFNRIAELVKGDVVLIETKTTYYVYKVTSHEIVVPTDTAVILPTPDQPGVKATKKLLTMTSCHPEFSSRERYVVHAELSATYSHDKGVPADVLKVANQ